MSADQRTEVDRTSHSYLLGKAEAEIERLRAALSICGAEYRSPPCTLGNALAYVAEEFQKRMETARQALAHEQSVNDGKG